MTTTPNINLNGTAPEALFDQNYAAYKAVQDAMDALCAAAPHGRDYYDEHRFRAARAEHYNRIKALEGIAHDLEVVALSTRGEDQALNIQAALRLLIEQCERCGVTEVPAGDTRPDLEQLRHLIEAGKLLLPKI